MCDPVHTTIIAFSRARFPPHSNNTNTTNTHHQHTHTGDWNCLITGTPHADECVRLLKKSQRVLIDDGSVVLRVVRRVNTDMVICMVEVGGPVGQFKGLNVPDLDVHMPALTVYINIRVCVYMCVYIYMCVCFMCVYVYDYVYVCVYVCVCIAHIN